MRPPLTRQNLLCHFSAGFRPGRKRLIGLEYEMVGVHEETGQAISYDSEEASVIAVLDGLCREYGWHPSGGEPLLELERDGSRITLEPGSQLELSLRPHPDLGGVAAELSECLIEVESIARPLGLRFLALGQQPLTRPEEITVLPKERYRIMTRYLPTRGRFALWMMRITAGMQVNLDLLSPDEAARALRLALRMASVVTALFANSPLTGGQANGWLSHRGRVWLEVDSERCTIPPGLTADGAGIEDYLNWAFDAGMFFVQRGPQLIDMTGTRFSEFLDGGRCGIKPLLADWETHLTTLFPEARLKNYLELRCADANRPELALAFAALAVGLFYGGTELREEASALFAGWSDAQRLAFHEDCTRRGLEAEAPSGARAQDLAQALLELAGQGLDALHPEERHYLIPAEKIVATGRTPAEELLATWEDWPRSSGTIPPLL